MRLSNIISAVALHLIRSADVGSDNYRFATEEGNKTLLEMASREDYFHLYRNEGGYEDNDKYLVPVRWMHTVSRNEAFGEVCLFGNQNTVCKPTTPKWSHTVNRLKQVCRIDDERK